MAKSAPAFTQAETNYAGITEEDLASALEGVGEFAKGDAAGLAGYPVDIVSTLLQLGGKGLDLGNPEDIKGSSAWLRKLMDVPEDSIPALAGEFASPDPLDAAKLSMLLFHGSPHLFNKFDASRIGTGEGSQAFGHGLYAAENKAVGKEYQEGLSRYQPVYEGEISPEAVDVINQAWRASDIDDPQKLRESDLKEWLETLAADTYHNRSTSQKGRDALTDELLALDPGKLTMSPGHLYEVDVPDEHIAGMLDWDKPLMHQPKSVQAAIMKAYEGSDYTPKPGDIGSELYGGLKVDDSRGAGAPVSEKLRELGIPGIKYYDEASRPANVVEKKLKRLVEKHGGDVEAAVDEHLLTVHLPPKEKAKTRAGLVKDLKQNPSTRNFVIFDPEHMTIVSRDGKPVNQPQPEKPRPSYLTKSGEVNKRRDPLIDRQRTAYPGIYKDPKELAAEAEALATREAEDPALFDLFGVTRGDLYDISQGGTRQGNKPGILPGQAKNPKGSEAARNVMTPANATRLVDALTAAQEHAPELTKGMTGWYVMDPLYWKFVEEYGPEGAKKAYDKWNHLTAMASPNSDVLTEWNRGSAAHMLDKQGRFDDFLKYGGVKGEDRGPDFPADMAAIKGTFGHLTSQGKPMQRYLETGRSQLQSAKVPMYLDASGVPEVGFQTDFPVGDAHFVRGLGLPDTRGATTKDGKPTVPDSSISGPEAGDIGPWFRENVAKQVGTEAVPAQANMWGLFAPQTGVKTPTGAPKLELLAKQVMKTAAREGISPKEALQRIIRGTSMAGQIDPKLLIGMGGAAGALGVALMVDKEN